MSREIPLEECAYYSDERVKGVNILTKEFVSTDSLLQNKGGLTNPVSLPKGNLISYNTDDILIGNIRPYLKKIWYSNRKGGCSPDVLVFRAKSNINSKFLYYSLFRDDFFTHMMKGAKGTKMPRGDKKQIMRFEIPLFDLTTQQKIASVLSSLDSKIELNNRINAELEAMAKTIYDYWFVQFDFPDKNGKPYKSSGGKMVWNEELKREVPEGWEVKDLGDYIELFDSKRIPLSSRERALKKGIIPYYGATGVMDYVDEYIFDDEYILLAEDGSVMDEKGYPIIQFIWGKTWVNNHAHVIQASNSLQNEFFFYHMKTIPVILIKTGSIQMKINQDNLKKHRVLIPNDNLINQFSAFANSIRNILKNNIEQNQQLASLRDWLLPMLMNGQVKVN